MREIPGPQEIYRHFKGGIYQILTLAEHTQSGEKLVIYQAMYGDFKVYARPLAMFMERVDRSEHPEETQEYRFERIEISGGETLPPERQENIGTETETTVDADVKPDPGQSKEEEEPWEEVPGVDPLVIRFLDADSYSEKLEILTALHGRITDSMINTMAISIDVEVEEGEIEDRYDELRRCLLLYDKFECTRLR